MFDFIINVLNDDREFYAFQQIENSYKIKKTEKKCLVIRGLPEKAECLQVDGLDIYNHLGDEEFREKVTQSDKIICRSGYSTIMDLHALNKRAILIPTPGQTEQEYLAKHHSG